MRYLLVDGLILEQVLLTGIRCTVVEEKPAVDRVAILNEADHGFAGVRHASVVIAAFDVVSLEERAH